MRRNKHFILLDGDGLNVFRWQGKGIQRVLTLTQPEGAVEHLSACFPAGHKPLRLFVDVQEETYKLDLLPHLGAKDRKALLIRKNKQHFPGSRFSHVQAKGRSDNERRDDKFLFFALTDDEVLERWLRVLYVAKVKIAGIHSFPVLLESLVDQLSGYDNKLLLNITFSKTGSALLRQSYFLQGILALSRFKKINVSNLNALAEEVREDVNRSQRFISRHFAGSNPGNISVYCFGSGENGDQVFRNIDFSGVGGKCHHFSLAKFAQKQGYSFDANYGLPQYFAAINAKKMQLPTHYKDANSRFYYRHHRLAQNLNFASVILLLGALVFSGVSQFQVEGKENMMQHLRTQRDSALNALSNIAHLPEFKGFDPFLLQEQLRVKKQIRQQTLSPFQILTAISEALDPYPAISLKRVEWGVDSSSSNADESMVDAAAFDDPTMIDPMIPQPQVSTVPIKIQAVVSNFDGNYRQSLALIERFQGRLGQSRAFRQVTATQLPVDISAETELRGAIRESNRQNQFTLEMQWTRNNEQD